LSDRQFGAPPEDLLCRELGKRHDNLPLDEADMVLEPRSRPPSWIAVNAELAVCFASPRNLHPRRVDEGLSSALRGRTVEDGQRICGEPIG